MTYRVLPTEIAGFISSSVPGSGSRLWPHLGPGTLLLGALRLQVFPKRFPLQCTAYSFTAPQCMIFGPLGLHKVLYMKSPWRPEAMHSNAQQKHTNYPPSRDRPPPLWRRGGWWLSRRSRDVPSAPYRNSGVHFFQCAGFGVTLVAAPGARYIAFGRSSASSVSYFALCKGGIGRYFCPTRHCVKGG